MCFKLFGFSFVEVLHHRIDQAAKEGCLFLKDMVNLMDRLTQGDNLTPDEMEIISYHLGVTRDTQFADVTKDSQNGNEFQMKTQPIVSQFSYTFTPNAINPHVWIFITRYILIHLTSHLFFLLFSRDCLHLMKKVQNIL